MEAVKTSFHGNPNKFQKAKFKEEHSQNSKFKSETNKCQNVSNKNNDRGRLGEMPSVETQTVQYYQRLLNLMNKGFDDEEEKEVFITNIVKQLKEQTFQIVQSNIGSSLTERLLPYLDIETFCHLLENVSINWEVVCSSKSASFIVQAFIKLARHHFLDEPINSTKDQSPISKEDFKVQQERLFCLLTEGLFKYLLSNLAFHMQHQSISHIIRGLFELLSTQKMNEKDVFGRKGSLGAFKTDPQKIKMDELYKSEVRKKYKKKMAECLLVMARCVCALPKLEDHALNCFSGPLLQVLMQSLAVLKSEEAKETLEKLIMSLKTFVGDDDEEDDDEDEDGDDEEKKGGIEKIKKVSHLLIHPAGSRMMECILTHSSHPLHNSIYIKFFKDHLLTLVYSEIGHFALQTLIQTARTTQQFEDIYNELRDHLERLLFLNQASTLLKLATAAVRLHSCQQLILQDLIKCFHCTHHPKVFVRLLLSLKTYQAFYNKLDQVEVNFPPPMKRKKKESEQEADVNTSLVDAENENAADTSEVVTPLLTNVDKYGSLILQQLMLMDEPGFVMECIQELNVEEMEMLACDRAGCHFFEVFFSEACHVAGKEKKRVFKLFRNKYLKLACSMFGSRTLDSIWSFSDDKKKTAIRNELKQHIPKIRSDKYGHFIFFKCGFTDRKNKNDSNNKNINENKNNNKIKNL